MYGLVTIEVDAVLIEIGLAKFRVRERKHIMEFGEEGLILRANVRRAVELERARTEWPAAGCGAGAAERAATGAGGAGAGRRAASQSQTGVQVDALGSGWKVPMGLPLEILRRSR